MPPRRTLDQATHPDPLQAATGVDSEYAQSTLAVPDTHQTRQKPRGDKTPRFMSDYVQKPEVMGGGEPRHFVQENLEVF